MKKFYEIKFDTKKGFPKSLIIHVEASNKAEAISWTKELWQKDSRLRDMHLFHFSARQLKGAEEFKYHYFAICGE